jgi:hypothetical protein
MTGALAASESVFECGILPIVLENAGSAKDEGEARRLAVESEHGHALVVLEHHVLHASVAIRKRSREYVFETHCPSAHVVANHADARTVDFERGPRIPGALRGFQGMLRVETVYKEIEDLFFHHSRSMRGRWRFFLSLRITGREVYSAKN